MGQSVRLERDGDVFVLTMTAGENRWNTAFVAELDAAVDEVVASSGPAALVTASADPKFFSNGLDLAWITSKGDHPGGDRRVFASVAMGYFARMMTLPVPTVCAIGGHAFGAGLMVALCHDVRVMRRDRGFLCANEIELGMAIPEPELALFRHKLPMNTFYETVQLARRWNGTDAQAAGIVQQLADGPDVLAAAVAEAARLAPLGANRAVFGWQKEHLFGERAALNGLDGPAYMLRNPHLYPHGPGRGSS